MKTVTVAQVFDIAIAAECAAQDLFNGLEEKFTHHPDVAELWHQYAIEEVAHADYLRKLRAQTPEGQLAQPVEAETVRMLRKVADFSAEEALENVNNLEDAYQLVHEAEHGEINAIFTFLLDHFEGDAEMRDFLRDQLDAHIAKLSEELPTKYQGTVARRSVQVLS
jgi:hypothetical protein